MTLLELVTYLREAILDDAPTSVDWTTISSSDEDADMLRWTNEQLTDFINRAEYEVARRTQSILDSTITISIDDSTGLYTLPSYVLRGGIRSIQLDSTGRQLEEASIDDIIRKQNWNTDTGTPTHYILDYQVGKILLYRIPTATSDTLNLIAYRGPTAKMSWTSNSVDSPEISVENDQYLMLEFAASLAYQKDDGSSVDQQLSLQHLAAFNKHFPELSVQAEISRQRYDFGPAKYNGYSMNKYKRSGRSFRNRGGRVRSC